MLRDLALVTDYDVWHEGTTPCPGGGGVSIATATAGRVLPGWPRLPATRDCECAGLLGTR